MATLCCTVFNESERGRRETFNTLHESSSTRGNGGNIGLYVHSIRARALSSFSHPVWSVSGFWLVGDPHARNRFETNETYKDVLFIISFSNF